MTKDEAGLKPDAWLWLVAPLNSAYYSSMQIILLPWVTFLNIYLLRFVGKLTDYIDNELDK